MNSTAGWAAFRFRDFRFFCAARLLSGLAMQMEAVAVGWYVYEVTRSAWALGLVGLAAFTPSLVFALVTGHVADRFDRRLVVSSAFGLIGLAMAGLFLCVWLRVPAIWPIYVLVAVVGTARAFGNPASQAILPNLVPREHFGNAIAWNSSAWQTASITGPAIGGILYAVSPAAVFAISALAFGIASVLIAALHARPARPEREKPTLATLLAGLTFIRSRPVVFGAISLDLVAVLLGGATALLPIFAQDVLHVGPWGLGLLRSMPAAGALLMALTLAHWPLHRHVGRRMLQSVALFGAATVGFGLSTSLYVSMACLLVAGAADMISVVIRQTLVQGETPDTMRGRVAAVNTIFIGASNELGEFESGSVAALLGAVPAVVLGGVATILVAFAWARLFPALRDRDRLISDPPGA